MVRAHGHDQQSLTMYPTLIHLKSVNTLTLVSSVLVLHRNSAQNGNLDVPVCFTKAKQGWAVTEMEKRMDKWLYEIQEQKKLPVWYTGPFRALRGNTNACLLLPAFLVNILKSVVSISTLHSTCNTLSILFDLITLCCTLVRLVQLSPWTLVF
jgi:hypothetical protein